ncbi:MAG: 4-hydroxythreonine-4-phosphate dehydrogenase PdxA [Bacteroidetes bacterium]|nr:4-hydroxythreonine-4-phosphate dehydrogenase PdxA [Bacteroidota bacterium]
MQQASNNNRPSIGITCGDINGIGAELIIKALSDARLLELCNPVVFASNKLINFYRKSIPDVNFNYQNVKELNRISPRQITLFNCWEEEISITPGQLNEVGGKYGIKSLEIAAQALKENKIQGLVTAPIHKKNSQSPTFNYTGHTPYLKALYGVKDVCMLMVAENMRVGLVTEHVPVAELPKYITREAIISKLAVLKDSLMRDFGIEKPKIAVLGLNPHAGDEGLVGKEEETIIKPAIKDFKQSNSNVIVTGPYSADAFFARGNHEKFDAVLAMYHDQGLIPFKSLAIGEGVNYTAGLPGVRTSPDHGTAFDIAGKNKANEASLIAAIFKCIDIIEQRAEYEENRRNPIRKVSDKILAGAEDEKIEEEGA